MPNGFQFLLKEVVDEFRMTNGRCPVGGMGNREVKAEADRRWEVIKKLYYTAKIKSGRVRVRFPKGSGPILNGFGCDFRRVRVRFSKGSAQSSSGFDSQRVRV